MSSVAINPPKTPATKGSKGIAKATLPNVCKMPGPPAPFVPSPLPNIAKSGSSPKGYSKKVKIEGNTVAIRGATFKSMGDMASKGTGGGLISANAHGIAKFITPGSLNVKIEGKSVHLLGEPMLNNCGASGSPPNTGATLSGVFQDQLMTAMRKNPGNDEICENGTHDEETVKPIVDENETVESRIQSKEAAAQNAGDRFEVAAVRHNINAAAQQPPKLAGISNPDQISRGPMDSDKVWSVCRKCGYRREVDHVLDDGTAVEAKCSAKAVSDSKQKVNNGALSGGSIYKSPSKKWDQAKSLWDDYGIRHITVP